jgi:DNA-binding MarR family transcriptional regulator
MKYEDKSFVVLDALSQEESMGRKIKRETGIEPATLSLEVQNLLEEHFATTENIT